MKSKEGSRRETWYELSPLSSLYPVLPGCSRIDSGGPWLAGWSMTILTEQEDFGERARQVRRCVMLRGSWQNRVLITVCGAASPPTGAVSRTSAFQPG